MARQAVNPFYVQPGGDISGGLRGLAGQIGEMARTRKEFELEKAAKAQDIALRQEAANVLQRGDTDEIQKFLIQNPSVAKDVDSAYQFKSKITEENAISTAWDIVTGKKSTVQALTERAEVVDAEGGDASDTIKLALQEQQDPQANAARKEAELLLMRKDPEAWDRYQKTQKKEDGKPIPKQKTGAFRVRDPQGNMQIAVGVFDPASGTLKTEFGDLSGYDVVSAIGETGPEETKRKIGQRRGEVAATGEETRASALIDRGILAAESSAVIRRGLELLDSVKTGGLDNVNLQAKRIFGVEGADEGELSNALGKAVLSQLRETFGAQFTQEEGNRLIRLEAGFGKSVANNRRLLGQALRIVERTARRAKKAAKARGDMATVSDIDELLSFSLSTNGAVEPKATSELSDAELFKAAGMQ